MMKIVKIKDLIKITKPKYVYLKLTPNNSVRNQSTHKIAKTISSIYKSIFQKIKKEETKLIKKFGKEFLIGTKYSFSRAEKLSYLIYIEKKKVEFYFVVPEEYVSLIKERMQDVWSGVTIDEVDKLPQFNNALKYKMQFDKEDALSLQTDRRNNELLRSNLNVINVLEDDDSIGIFYNFIPTSQNSWRHKYKYTIDKVNNGEPVDKEKGNVSYVFKYSLKILTSLINEVLEVLNVFADDKKKEQENVLESLMNKIRGNNDLSQQTLEKENATILDTQIVIFSKSKNDLRKHNNARSVTQSFETISKDNRLVPKRFKREVDYLSYKIKGAPTNSVSDVECNNFISLAGRDILEEYNFIDKVSTTETQVPEDLWEGTFRLGVNTFRGHKQKAFLTDHIEYKFLSLFLIGPSRSGKTTLIGNLSYDAVMNDECVILFDFIENCEMSTQVASLFDENQVLNIVCDNKDDAQGLGYNEIRFSEDPDQQYINAKTQTTQLSTLINSVNVDDAPLTARMKRYLTSASLVVFLSDGPVKDVFSVLQNDKIRREYIGKVKEEQKENMREYLDYLFELDEIDKKTGEIIGTKLSYVEGIISRLNLLKDNPYMELMLKKETKDNIDLVSEMEKNKLICIKMPEHMFNTDEERDVYCIYWATKIWLALQVRATLIPDKDKRKKVNMFIDEMYQVQNTETFVSDKLSRFAKFRLKPIVSCHYLQQLKHMKKELAGANASYLLISGCDKNNFRELESELRPYSEEDLLNLPEHHSLNLIKNKSGYGRFITKLPPPVNDWVEQERKEKDKKVAENA